MKFGKNLSKSLVRNRRQQYEEHLHVADLRENLTHEEFGVPVDSIYDFSHGKDAKEVGGFGEVQVVIHRKTGTRYAMKTVKLSSVKSEKAFDFIMNEVDLLKTLDHPNIVRLQACLFFYRTSIESDMVGGSGLRQTAVLMLVCCAVSMMPGGYSYCYCCCCCF
ncbi:unnamed protein product [Ectocarpus sp. 13 AM-2016]